MGSGLGLEDAARLTVFCGGLTEGAAQAVRARRADPGWTRLGWTVVRLPARASPRHLRVDPDLTFVETAAGRIDLLRKPALRAVCRALVERHRRGRRRGLRALALFAASHPDEHIDDFAAVNRIRVAIASLRRLGLRGLIVTRGEEYLLDPEAVVVEV